MTASNYYGLKAVPYNPRVTDRMDMTLHVSVTS